MVAPASLPLLVACLLLLLPQPRVGLAFSVSSRAEFFPRATGIISAVVEPLPDRWESKPPTTTRKPRGAPTSAVVEGASARAAAGSSATESGAWRSAHGGHVMLDFTEFYVDDIEVST